MDEVPSLVTIVLSLFIFVVIGAVAFRRVDGFWRLYESLCK